MCCTRSACTGDTAVAGVVTSSFFVVMAAAARRYHIRLLSLSFVAAFASVSSGAPGSTLVLSPQSVYCCNGDPTLCCACSSQPRGKAVQYPRLRCGSYPNYVRGPVKDLDRLSPEAGHFFRSRDIRITTIFLSPTVLITWCCGLRCSVCVCLLLVCSALLVATYARAVLMVCSVLLRRDLLYILHACYAIGKRDYLVYTVKCILPTQRSHRAHVLHCVPVSD